MIRIFPQTWDLDSVLAHPGTDEFQKELADYSALLRNLAVALAGLPAVGGDMDETALAAFLAADPRLEGNAFYFEDTRRRATLRLPAAQEQFASELEVDGFSAWGRLYDRLSGNLRVTVMERGELVEKSPGQVPLGSPEYSVRQNNFGREAMFGCRVGAIRYTYPLYPARTAR